jgi:hypothetical protein
VLIQQLFSTQSKENKISGSKESPHNFRTPAVIESALERWILSQNIVPTPFFSREKNGEYFFLKKRLVFEV